MSNFNQNLIRRPRRLRSSHQLRSLIQEKQITLNDFIVPLFITEDLDKKSPIDSMPDQYRYGYHHLLEEIGELKDLGLKAVCLFPVCKDNQKDPSASACLDESHFYYQRIAQIKKNFPEILVMTDVALDPYSSDGHDGLVDRQTGKILNDETIDLLCKMSILQAKSGADIIGPSDMMDGRIAAIRRGLDESGYTETSIMSYTAKYASAFYGPFRDALDSTPKSGDKKSYQMNPGNIKEALIEAESDFLEGADVLMVKPALAYLDVIQSLNQSYDIPISAYQVSGEYSMIKFAARAGAIDELSIAKETLLSIKRAGASIILSYFSKEIARDMKLKGHFEL